MSRIRADKFVNRAASGAPELTYGAQVVTGYGITGAGGINITGVVTATGGWGGTLAISDTTDSTSSTTGAFTVAGGVGIAKSLFVGNNVTIGGTVTYEDVTNVDSVGIITAQTGVKVTAGGVDITAGGLKVTAGVSTFSNGISVDDVVVSSGATLGMTTATTTQVRVGGAVTFAQSYINFNQTLIEKTNTAGTTLGAATTCGLVKGMVYYCTGNESGNLTINFTQVARTGDSDAGIALTSVMGVGEVVSPTVIITPNNSGKINAVKIDDVAQTFEENGGSFTAGSDGYDVYSFTILRTGTSSTGFLVLASLTNHT